MLGPILMILTLLIAMPISFFVLGAVISMLLGQFLTKEGVAMNENSELIELNV